MQKENILKSLPQKIFCAFLFLLRHSFYRISVLGYDNLPRDGGALLVCNHSSFVDAFLLLAAIDRPVRLLMNKEFYDLRLLKPFAKMIRVIPISSEQRPREMIHSLRIASEAIGAGELVCIFAEGEVTRTGQMLPFRRGLELIMRGVEAPIIPIGIDGAWGSIFSYERGCFLWKFPLRIPYPVTVNFGRPLPTNSTAFEIRNTVQQLQSEAFPERKCHMKTLGHAFSCAARTHPRKFLMADARTGPISLFAAFRKAIILARRLRRVIGEGEYIGLILPPSSGAALVNLAITLLGRVPVNLDYRLSEEALLVCTRQCPIKIVITSRSLINCLPQLGLQCRTESIEDIESSTTLYEECAASVASLLMPYRVLEKWLRAYHRVTDDTAAVIFTIKNAGEPKGVILTHYNINANVQQVSQVFGLRDCDKVLGALPLSDSLGLMATFWIPILGGAGVVYHDDLLDARGTEELVWKYDATYLVGTSELLESCLRCGTPEKLGGLQYVFVRTHALSDQLALAFEDRFGIRPSPGYICDECSSIVAVSRYNYRARGFHQVAIRRGRLGHPLPGVSLRIVDIETGKPVSPGIPGRLLVKGPNVMRGYIGMPSETANVVRDGWYNTGDTAVIGEEGFLAILDSGCNPV